jgi:ribonuclease HII
MKIPNPTFQEEQILWNNGLHNVAGVDEVGRGAFAGPVVAAAVILPSAFPHMEEIHDSKLLTSQKRNELDQIIKSHAVSYAISEVSLAYINTIGIGDASQLALCNAVSQLAVSPDFILSDAFYLSRFDKSIQKPIIKGDQKSISIAAASIIAKVYRDTLMENLESTYSVYNFSKHKGYGTKEHRNLIKVHGLCDLHRTSFNLTKFL